MCKVKMPKPMAYIVLAGGRIYEVYDDEGTAHKVASCLDGCTATVIPLVSTTQAEAYKDACVRELQAAAEDLADWAEHEVGAWPELTPGLKEIRDLIPKGHHD